MSQPSPSGDELLWEFMAPFIGPTGGWLVSPKKFHAAIADWLRSHDAKVSGQAEKRLKKIKSIVEDPARKVEYGIPEYYLLQRLSVALQESPR